MPSAVVYGGAGALGRGVVALFRKHSWSVLSVDLFGNEEANVNVLLGKDDSWQQSSDKVLAAIQNELKDGKVQAIINVAGGWAGGNIASADVIKNTELMLAQSVQSSLIAGQLAATYLAEGGLLVLTGAAAATKGTPGMIAYGTAKAAVHHLVKSFAAHGSGVPSGVHTVGLLPITLDTPSNRKFAAADTDFSSWTPVDAIATKLLAWANGSERPANGDLVQVSTSTGTTSFTVV